MINWRSLLSRNEVLVALIILVLCVVLGVARPDAFFSAGNLFRILTATLSIGVFALGVLVVLISGGIDVSFPAIAVFAMYATVTFLNNISPEGVYEGSVILPFVLAGVIGLGLGLINAVFIALFRLPTLIVTLGTLNAFVGFLRFFVGSVVIRDNPLAMDDLARTYILTVPLQRGVAQLHAVFLVLPILAVIVFLVLRYTMLGRGIYAMGGDREAAERAGFNLVRIQFFIYAFVGVMSGIAGVILSSLSRRSDPFDIVGTELEVIAAVVLGGASITGGRGTVIGTLLGVLLITLISENLVLLGIPTEWQKVVIGILIIIGTGLPAIQERIRTNQPRLAAEQN